MSELREICYEVKWNTGCHYGPEGQRMTALLIHGDYYNDFIWFKDEDRNLTGLIPVYGWRHFVYDERRGVESYDERKIQEWVMACYLRGQYTDQIRDWTDHWIAQQLPKWTKSWKVVDMGLNRGY